MTKLNITRQQYESLLNQGITREEIIGMSEKEAPKPTDFLDKTAGVFDAIFGGKYFGEAIGTQLAKRGFTGLSEEERKEVSPGPTKKQLAGDVLRTGALFTPMGKIGGIGAKLARPILGKTLGKVAGASAAGGVAGLGFDVGEGLREQESPHFFATGLGVGLPPAFKGIGTLIKATGFMGSELAGISTGAGGKSIQEFYRAIRAGGDEAKAATSALRGKVSEDVVVKDAALALSKVVQRRNKEYVTKFKKIIDNKKTLDISPINNKMDDMLKNFQIKSTPAGLDFSQSAIRFNNQSQKEVTEIVEVMKKFGSQKGDRTPLGIDLLKQSIDDIYTESSKVRAFTASIRDSARKTLKNVKGYDEMAGDYENKTKFIKEITKTLSMKDTATIDTKLRKLLSSLRQQQGFKDELVKQLDEEAGTFITAQIAGQQLKEALPQGILRAFGPLGAGLAGLSVGGSIGSGLMALFPALAIMSPRVIGEFVKVMGVGSSYVDDVVRIIQKVGPKGARTPGDVLAGKLKGKKPPSVGMTIEDITKKGKGEIPPTSTLKGDLLQEAKKYKSADEFWADYIKKWRRTEAKFEKVKKGELGYETGAVKLANTPDYTKSQLTDIWKQAVN